MSSYSTYYNKVSLCSKSGQTGPIGPTGPRGLLGPQGPPGESTLGNITVGSYNDNDNENNFDLVAYQNVSNILFDENSFIIDVRDNIILDSSTILISLGSSFNSFETWKFDGSNPPLVAQGETSVTFENGKNITIESSNSDSPKLSITAIPELTSTIVDNNKCLKLEELYNFIPTEYPGQDLGSSNYPWSSLYVSRVFALNTIYLGTMSIESTTNGELSINNKSITTIIKENELIIDLSSQVYINESDISKNIIDIIKNTYDINQLKNLVDENKSQIVGYIQTQFKNTGFTEYDVTQDLDLVEGYNLTIIPSQPNNNITINIRFSYRTSGQAGEKLRVQIGYNVGLNYHEVICDETMGTLNTSNLEQTFNFNYINKAKSSDPHYYWIKFQKILDSNVENLDLGNDYNTKIFNSFGNLIMLQELIGTNISEITNNMGSSEGTENKSQISGYIQTQFKNTGFSEYYVPQNLDPVEGYNLTIIPSQPNNNIIINIRFSYRTSGQAGEKLRVQIGYNVVALDYHEVICDETMGTLNTSNLEQTFNFNYINKAKGNYQHYYWIKFQKILHSNVENLDLGNDYNTKILNSVGNLIMLQEVVGTNIYEITNNTVWSQGTENTLSYNLGNIGINTENPTEKLEIDGSVKITGQNSFLNIPSNPPITSNSYGKQGDITWDNNYIYVCVAENSWKRTSFSKDNW